ncbi:MAG: DUF1385 domain-containing protein [Bacteroidetes bacterium]|nr:DUF1385 domain-containing protein [Bacteroidota bacterium]
MSEPSRSSWVPTNPLYDPDKPMQIGGQAVIEGVMMRAPGSVATAVRRTNGDIVVQHLPYRSVIERNAWLNKPVIRGAIGLVDMMVIGIKTLNFSADVAMRDAETADASVNGTKREEPSRWALALSLVFALGFGILLFFVTPLLLTTVFFDIEQNALQFNLVAGSVRVTMFLLYLIGISFIKDIKRLFQYHGAEHKSVFAFELNVALQPPAVAGQSRFHPRCGTSFLLIVMIVAILTFAILDTVLISWLGELTLFVRLATHLPFLPVVAGVSYEIIKFSARHSTTWWGKILVAPGLWLQTVTTREPDESQIEVAIVALRCALGQDDAGRYPYRETSSAAA